MDVKTAARVWAMRRFTSGPTQGHTAVYKGQPTVVISDADVRRSRSSKTVGAAPGGM